MISCLLSVFFSTTLIFPSDTPNLAEIRSSYQFYVDKGTIKLEWSELTLANGYFHVERSMDGRVYYPVNKVKARGDTVSEYRFIDIRPFKGLNYYRIKYTGSEGDRVVIKQIKIDNTSATVPEFQVSLLPEEKNFLIVEFLKVTQPFKGYLILLDMRNNEPVYIKQLEILLKEGNPTVFVEQEVPKGVYEIVLSGEYGRRRKTIVIH